MARSRLFLRVGSGLLAVLFTTVQLGVRPAAAGMLTTEAIVAARDAEAARARLRTFLARADVERQIVALGVDPAEARARVATLTDRELAMIEARLDEIPAGEGFLEAVAAILVVILLVFLLTDLFGWTDVFPFVNPLPRGTAKN